MEQHYLNVVGPKRMPSVEEHTAPGHFWFRLLGKAQNNSREILVGVWGGTVTKNTNSGELGFVIRKWDSHPTLPFVTNSKVPHFQVDANMHNCCSR